MERNGVQSFCSCLCVCVCVCVSSLHLVFVCACQGVLEHVCKLMCVWVCVFPQPFMPPTCVSQSYKRRDRHTHTHTTRCFTCNDNDKEKGWGTFSALKPSSAQPVFSSLLPLPFLCEVEKELWPLSAESLLLAWLICNRGSRRSSAKTHLSAEKKSRQIYTLADFTADEREGSCFSSANYWIHTSRVDAAPSSSPVPPC